MEVIRKIWKLFFLR